MKDLFLIGVDKDIVFMIRDEMLGNIIGYAALEINPTLDFVFLGTDQIAAISLPPGTKGIMTLDQSATKKTALKIYEEHSIDFERLVSSDAIISQKAKIGRGSIIQKKAFVSDEVTIGDFVKIQIGVNLFHEVKVHDFSTIAPNATILGNVDIGTGSYVGAGATILQNIKVGDNCIIGAGAVVVEDVADGRSVAGVPARQL